MAKARAIAERSQAPHPVLGAVQALARLVFDNHSGFAPAAATRSGALAARHRLYETDAHYLDLWQDGPSDGSFYLIGQLYAKTGSRAVAPDRVRVLGPGGAEVDAGMRGLEMHISGLKAGLYDIVFETHDGALVAPAVDVGEADA